MSLTYVIFIGLLQFDYHLTLSFHNNTSVTYTIEEELSHQMTIGNLYSDFKVDEIATDRNCSKLRGQCSLMFFPSSQPARKYFSLITSSSNFQETYLITNSRIDREAICYDEETKSKIGNNKICKCKYSDENSEPVCSTVFQVTLSPFLENQIFYLLLVKIIIIDKNDNPPVFSQKSVNVYFSLKKGGPKYVILPNATDKDIGINSFIIYKIMNWNHLVNITPSYSGLNFSLKHIKTKEINFESQPLLVKILAKNIRKPFYNDTLIARLFIDNIIPASSDMFSSKIYYFKIEENVEYGTFIGQVFLKEDIKLKSRFYLKKCFEYVDKNSYLIASIGLNDGIIKSSRLIDREDQSMHCLEVIATLGEYSEVTGTATVSIKILDINDNSPKIGLDISIMDKKEVEVYENRPIDSTILTLFPEDPDEKENGTIHCDCLSNGQFAIDLLDKSFRFPSNYINGRLSYILINRIILDREIASFYSIMIYCQDKGKVSLTTSLSLKLRILDMNDNAPFFSKSFYQVSYSEDIPIGSHIISVNATDLDATRINSQIFYSIQKSENSDSFSINERTGEISLISALDYETCTYIVLNVIASDRGYPRSLSGIVVLYFTVMDINDCFPQLQPSYTIFFAENLPPQSLVTSIVALDMDTGLGGKVIHFISDTQFFSCSPLGDIKSKASFDRETRSSYVFILYAKDQGNPSLTSSASVFVTITDVNDNDPEFVFPPSSHSSTNISISYRESPSSELTKVSSRDIDEGDNAKVTYAFYPYLLQKDIFFINATSGYIYITSTPGKSNLHKTFTLRVMAYDHGTPEPRQSNATLRITIANIDPILKVKSKMDFSRIPLSIFDKMKSEPSEFSSLLLWNVEYNAITMILVGILIIVIMSIITAVICVCQRIQFPVFVRERANVSSVSTHLVSNTRSGVTITWRQRIKTPSVKWKCMASMLHFPYKSSPSELTDIPVACSNDYVDSERESLQLIKTSRTLDRHRLDKKDNDYEVIRSMNTRSKTEAVRPTSLIRQISSNSDSSVSDERMVTII